jgi:hypothetical protein
MYSSISGKPSLKIKKGLRFSFFQRKTQGKGIGMRQLTPDLNGKPKNKNGYIAASFYSQLIL